MLHNNDLMFEICLIVGKKEAPILTTVEKLKIESLTTQISLHSNAVSVTAVVCKDIQFPCSSV